MDLKNKSHGKYGIKKRLAKYRFLIFTGILLLTICVAGISVYFYFKYSDFIYLILALLISLVALSHLTSRMAIRVVKYVHKKQK